MDASTRSPDLGTPRRTLWQRLVEPSAALRDLETRRQARLLASLLACLLPTLLVGATASGLSGGDLAGASVLAGAAVVCAVAYALSRSRHYLVAAALTLGAFSAVPGGSFFGITLGPQGYSYEQLLASFLWIVLPILLSSVLVPLRGVVLVAGANLAALLLVPLLLPAVPWTDLFPLIGLLLTVAALTIVTVRHRDLLERDRRAELLASNERLAAAQVELQARSAFLHDTVQRYDAYLAEIGRGHLALRLTLDEQREADPLSRLGRRLNETVGSLHEAIVRIRDTAGQLNAASAELLAAATQQASGAAEQSAAIAQTSTTIDEVRAIAGQTAQRAQGVAALAQRTAEVFQAGQQAVAATVASMGEVKKKVETIATGVLALSEQAQAIGGIIAAVSEIADQSHMLALNAAVEAARAGEAGKGFAVVATEVRALAEQSRAATTQVKDILTEIQRGVNTAVMLTEEGMKGTDAGVRVSGEAGAALQRLAESVREAAQAALQIAAAAGQQETGMEQIAQAVANIHQVTAQSVAGVQQVERAAGQLNSLAGELRELVEPYRL